MTDYAPKCYRLYPNANGNGVNDIQIAIVDADDTSTSYSGYSPSSNPSDSSCSAGGSGRFCNGTAIECDSDSDCDDSDGHGRITSSPFSSELDDATNCIFNDSTTESLIGTLYILWFLLLYILHSDSHHWRFGVIYIRIRALSLSLFVILWWISLDKNWFHTVQSLTSSHRKWRLCGPFFVLNSDVARNSDSNVRSFNITYVSRLDATFRILYRV